MVSLEHTIDILSKISELNINDLVINCAIQYNSNISPGKKPLVDIADNEIDADTLIELIKDMHKSDGITFEGELANQMYIEIYHSDWHSNYFEISVWANNNPEIADKKSVIDFTHTPIENFKATQTDKRLKKSRPKLDPKIVEVYALVEKYYEMYKDKNKVIMNQM